MHIIKHKSIYKYTKANEQLLIDVSKSYKIQNQQKY